MLYKINAKEDNEKWLQDYWNDFRRRFSNLLSYSFNMYSTSLALSILMNKTVSLESTSKYIINLLICHVNKTISAFY
jgi:N-acetyltransferase 10